MQEWHDGSMGSRLGNKMRQLYVWVFHSLESSPTNLRFKNTIKYHDGARWTIDKMFLCVFIEMSTSIKSTKNTNLESVTHCHAVSRQTSVILSEADLFLKLCILWKFYLKTCVRCMYCSWYLVATKKFSIFSISHLQFPDWQWQIFTWSFPQMSVWLKSSFHSPHLTLKSKSAEDLNMIRTVLIVCLLLSATLASPVSSASDSIEVCNVSISKNC